MNNGVQWSNYLKESDLRGLFFSAAAPETDEDDGEGSVSFNSPTVLSPKGILKTLKGALRADGASFTVGFTGYPNVGKSSTINRFLTSKKLQVSETPGKTKHYQTHVIDGNSITMVDGPGLVMPDLTKKKADMVLAGVLPIDTLTDHVSASDLLISRLSVRKLEKRYGLTPGMSSMAARSSGVGRSAPPSYGFLSALATARGYMKPGGVPDQHRAARLVLRDYVSGKLLFCRAPPEEDQEKFNSLGGDQGIDEEEEEVPDRDEDLFLLEESFPELRMSSAKAHVRRAAGSGGVGGVMEAGKKQ